jgi:hypothetical protein
MYERVAVKKRGLYNMESKSWSQGGHEATLDEYRINALTASITPASCFLDYLTCLPPEATQIPPQYPSSFSH